MTVAVKKLQVYLEYVEDVWVGLAQPLQPGQQHGFLRRVHVNLRHASGRHLAHPVRPRSRAPCEYGRATLPCAGNRYLTIKLSPISIYLLHSSVPQY